MTAASVTPHTWTERLRYVSDPTAQRSLAGKSLGVAIACVLGIGVGIGFILLGVPLVGWIVIGLAIAAILVWLAIAANAVGKGIADAGIDASMKVITLSLKDYEAVKARATTKARRMVLFAPMLGSAATVHVGLNGRTGEEVHRALQLLGAAAAQHGITFTRNT
ncbi:MULTISPECIES: hypothetical protein [Microbacterium]|uniref:hypothetical protein n=1 Tax=Microbacterium TaxID=33882 RepID=UPI00217EC928|nr:MULTISPECIES: hypothetical protein [Microbacterium]UWF76988.1 hypothetical protein JSY13_09205 [Microbacterium neungamense]WCM55148.1 hypothetical protein JRG78_09215 [Microbacterium sp. EF45047]